MILLSSISISVRPSKTFSADTIYQDIPFFAINRYQYPILILFISGRDTARLKDRKPSPPPQLMTAAVDQLPLEMP